MMFLGGGRAAYACGPYEYDPAEYLLFRVYDSDQSVVRMRPLIQLKDSDDPQVKKYLDLARRCESLRDEIHSAWYYPTKNDAVIAALNDVLEQALNYKGDKLKDRYALQAARAMFTLQKFEEMCQWWSEVEKDIEDTAIKDHIIGYVAGAKFRTGHEGEALKYYGTVGDTESIEYCLRQMGEYHGYESIEKYCSCSQAGLKELQDQIRNIELYSDYFVERGCIVIKDHYKKCISVAQNSVDPTPWLYTAAFLKYLTGEYYLSRMLIDKAEKTCQSEFLSGSIRVLRILLDASVSTYNLAYETRLLEDLKWLDSMICSNLTENVKAKTVEDPYILKDNRSYYYWNDMMRKILLGTVVPRMIEAGKVPLALMLANYADNRLLLLVDRHPSPWWWKNHEQTVGLTLKDYRHDVDSFNIYDYSNAYFRMLSGDSINVIRLTEYADKLKSPSSKLECFLAERVYIDDDYLNDVIGTRYLRICDYHHAHEYLSKVSSDYQERLNTNGYMSRLPFSYDKKLASSTIPDYKLQFAREMIECEKIMATSEDPDIAGHARIKYGIGMRNSMDYCWALTQYVKSHGWPRSEHLSPYIAKIYIARGERQIEAGLKQQSNHNRCDVLENYY